MAQALVNEFGRNVREVVLVPSGGGCYELKLDGKLIYSKLKTGLHLSDADALALIRQERA